MKSPRQLGFTLLELAVVLFVVALLLGGLLIPLTAQMEVRGISDTRRIMDQISEALIGYAQANGRLPCPALATLQTGIDASAGTAQYTSPSCTAQMGVIPWATLGVPETDAWGRRFTYRVADVFSNAIPASGAATSADWNTTTPQDQATGAPNNGLSCTSPPTTPTLSTFALCSLGGIAVLDRASNGAGAHSTSTVGSGLPAVFLSHGKNGYGAFQSNGTQVSGVTANTDEATNALAANGLSGAGTLGNAPSAYTFQSYLFYSRRPTPYSALCSETANSSAFCEYDDIVYMISAPMMVSRMISAGRLP